MLDEEPVGALIWHCSDEDSGPDVGVSIKLGDTKLLWCGEITSKLYREAECESYATEPGWWIILYDGDDDRVIAKCFDDVAARDAFDALGAAFRDT